MSYATPSTRCSLPPLSDAVASAVEALLDRGAFARADIGFETIRQSTSPVFSTNYNGVLYFYCIIGLKNCL
jgi:hypothetical protein